MTLTIVIGIAALLFIGAAVTGVVVDKEGKPSILIKSTLLRSLLAVSGSGLIALSVFMWNKELSKSDSDCSECESRLVLVNHKLEQMEQELERTQANINKSIEAVYEDSANFLIRVAMLIGNKSKLGCTLPIEDYQIIRNYDLSDPDICKSLKLLMHPVTISATGGIDERELIDSLSLKGIPSFISNGEKNNARSNKNLGVFFPDGTSKEVVCSVRNSYEKAYKKHNPSSKSISLRYALNIGKVGDIQKGKVIVSSQAIQLGIDVTKFAIDVKEITHEEWIDICSSSWDQWEFENFINDKSIEAKLPDLTE